MGNPDSVGSPHLPHEMEVMSACPFWVLRVRWNLEMSLGSGVGTPWSGTPSSEMSSALPNFFFDDSDTFFDEGFEVDGGHDGV